MSELFPYVTELGWEVDKVQIFLIAMMAFWFIACNAVMVYFILRYKRKGPNDKVDTTKGNHTLEVVWTVIPTILCFIIFYVGMKVWHELRTPPEDAMEIKVIGQKWSWNFEYTDPEGNYVFDTDEGSIQLAGRVTPGELFVPQGQSVKLLMKSTDVIHSMYIPEFRVKEDVVPNLYTHLWFNAAKAGTYHMFCTEYCGDEHSGMLGKVHVLTPEQWERFVRAEPIDPRDKKKVGAELGEELYTKHNCVGCHSSDGSKVIGPSFKGLIGRQFKTASGTDMTADENYIVESIKNPNKVMVAGYPANQMPAFDGIISDKEIEAIIDYIKTLQ